MKLFFISLFFISLFFTACGTSGVTSSSNNNKKIAYLKDTFVDGVQYKCGDTVTGITGDSGTKGSFEYKDDCEVTFFIGKVHIGKIDGNKIPYKSSLYPTTLLGMTLTDTQNKKVVNIIRFLQSLDEDNDVSNGITISNKVRTNLSKSTANTIDLTNLNLSEYDLGKSVKQADLSKTLITDIQAIAHFEYILTKDGYPKDTVPPAKPYLSKPLTRIKTFHTKKRTVEINGEVGSKIFLAFNTDGDINNINLVYQNITIPDTGKYKLDLSFDNDNISLFHYYIMLQDSKKHNSEILHLSIIKDFIPPYLKQAFIEVNVNEGQRLINNIDALDNGNNLSIISSSENNESIDYDFFKINNQGTLVFNTTPNFDATPNRVYNIIARVIDTAGNMTDAYIIIYLKNILDNPPSLINDKFFMHLEENLSNGYEVYDFNTTVEHNLTARPDNNLSFSPIYFRLHNYTDIFDINRSTGLIIVKDANSDLLDYESGSRSFDLNISVENNNTRGLDGNTTFANLHIDLVNVIDTAPVLIKQTDVNMSEHYDGEKTSTHFLFDSKLDENLNDFNKSVIFTISAGNDGNFLIDSNTGIVVSKADHTLDFEITPEYNLTIKVENTWWDKTTHTDEMNVTISINNVIDNPSIIKLSNPLSTIAEDKKAGIIIATIDKNGTTIDENNTDSYIITTTGSVFNANQPVFNINQQNGEIYTTRQLLNDYNETIDGNSTTKLTVTVKAKSILWNDTEVFSNEITFDINITNVIDNIPITDINDTNLSFEENSTTATGTTLATVTTKGNIYDENNVSRYFIVSGNDDKSFEINSTTGVLSNAKLFDWETTKNYTLKIGTSNIWWDNAEHNGTTVDINVTILNKIELPPKITGPDVVNIHENIDDYDIIAYYDVDKNATIDEQSITSFNIKENDNFLILKEVDNLTNWNYGSLSIKPETSNIDYESNKSYTLDINATNDAGSTIKTITINIINDIDANLPLIVILVQFNDINLSVADTEIENLIFESGAANKKTINNYFKITSKDKFLFAPADQNYSNDIVGIIRVDVNNSHPLNGFTALKNRVQDALSEADKNIDFKPFDINKDSNVTNDELQLLFIIAGGEIRYGDENQSIKARVGKFDSNLTYDKVNILSNFIVVGETQNGHTATIGLIAKLLAQSSLGFKSTKIQPKYKFGGFGLMGTGFNGHDGNETKGLRPIHTSVYNKSLQGWTNPILQRKGEVDSTIKIVDKLVYSTLRINDINDNNVYYLIENRNKTSNGTYEHYDNGLDNDTNKSFKGGLVVWKVDNNTDADPIVSQVPIKSTGGYNGENVFRAGINAVDDLDKNVIDTAFEFTDNGSEDDKTHEIKIGIKIK
jgi:hypothetical protein